MEWEADWVTAMDGAVDEDGWQYASSSAGSTWMATAQRQHQYKRRKWIRSMSTKKVNQGGSREVQCNIVTITILIYAYGDCLLWIVIYTLPAYCMLANIFMCIHMYNYTTWSAVCLQQQLAPLWYCPWPLNTICMALHIYVYV